MILFAKKAKVLEFLKRFVIFFLLFIIFSSAGFFVYLNKKYIPAVLMYHYVKDSSIVEHDKRYIRPQTFDKQMKFLKDRKYNVIPLEKFAASLKEKKPMPRDTIVITFDDGHLDNYQYAYPILKKYNLPATMFIIVGEIGQKDSMTLEQIREMSDSGLITIGSHTVSHEHLPSIKDKERIKNEIVLSKQVLEAIIKKPVNCFSYPIGGFNEEIRQMVIDAGHTTAVSTSPGLNYPNNDPYAIKRVRISESSSNLFTFWFEASGLYKHLLELRKEKSYD